MFTYQPHIAAYTYDAGGERGIRYVPRQQEGVSSGTTSGYAQNMDIMLYPNALITVRPQELPEDFDPMHMHPEHTFTTYTKHYYIGSERINSKLGTIKDLGILCEQVGGYDLLDEMNTRVLDAGKRLELLYNDLDKDIRLNSPYLYSREHQFVCDFKSYNPELYDAYWYHPDHLGSSSYITNTTGEISQHMEYLPFGETLVEEHLNSYNSPFKFNGKEYDAETGNYYYGARYLNPKWSMWLGVDPLAEEMPSWSPYNYAFNNPVYFIDPDGQEPWPITKIYNSASRIIVSGWLRNINSALHGGVDIAHLSNKGQISGGAIRSTHSGTVTISQSNNKTAGNWVVITNGDLRTRYLHMQDTPLVRVNDIVKEGEVIGYVGSTGRSEAPHVHYEIQRLIDGEWQKINPVVGGQKKVKSSDQVELIDPQKIIDERDGVNKKSKVFKDKLKSFNEKLGRFNSKLEDFNRRLEQKIENNKSKNEKTTAN